jgi:glycosyltransferase involved in cell wall biosynthesis
MHSGILHISGYDLIGGAARAAYRLHRGLLEAGMESRMLVADKRSKDETVTSPTISRRFDRRVLRRVRAMLNSSSERRIARALKPKVEFYSTAHSRFTGCWHQPIHDYSILNLHWVAGFLDYPSFFGALPSGKPLVWTLHDNNPFTGGCHYAGPCEKFWTRCGACPQLDSKWEKDDSRRTLEIKREAYAHLDVDRVAIVAPSTWVAAKARRSGLLSRFRVEHIPHGLDLDIFRPHDRDAGRKSFGLQAGQRAILFVSDALNNHRKGLDLLVSAIEGMSVKQDVVLMLVGGGIAPKLDKVSTIHFGRIESDLVLSLIYSIADVCVVPSREEQFGQTAAEATACGCPVVGFAGTGVSDIVEDALTGYLAAPLDIYQLREGIEAAIARRDAFSRACRERAVRLFGLATQASAYVKLYSSLLDAAELLAVSSRNRSTDCGSRVGVVASGGQWGN